jgi:serine/arginine repetitive matrix protein 2
LFSSTFRRTHKRTLTPAPEPEPEPLYQALHPAKVRVPSGTLKASYSSLAEKRSALGDNNVLAASALTFGSRSSSRAGSKGSMDEYSCGSLTPVFKRIHDQERKRSSLVPSDLRGSQGSQTSDLADEFSLPIVRETRKVLGMSGTMGGSDVSCYQGPDPDASDPDSDVPDELRYILASHSDRNSVAESFSFRDDQDNTVSTTSSPGPPTDPLPVPSSSSPPALQLPVFHVSLIDDEQNQYDIDGMHTSEEDTKNTFDFTGELQKLNESGASDRRSFVEQLENAFRTPAKVDLCYDFGGHLRPDVPPVPNVPAKFSTVTTSSGRSGDGSGSFGSQLLEVRQPTMFNTTRTDESQSQSQFDFESGSKLVDMAEPSSLLTLDDLSNDIDDVVSEKKSSSNLLASSASSSQRPSDGELDRLFRFGGLPRSQSSTSLAKDKQPLTLSDIIPPPSHVRSLSNSTSMDEDDSVLNSIFAKIAGVQGRSRASSDASARQIAREKRSILKAMSRPTSGISFTGFDSFDEVRRGFEFSDDCPTFYPPSAVTRRVPHRRHESALSIMSVSSYGHVINAGSLDPFDYGLPSLRESSEDTSSVFVMDIDDTFAFMENRPRRRVESDASSFYFRAPSSQQQSFTHGHRHRDSNMSVSSQAPPISLYNRSFATHRRNDSSASSSSVAMSYARHGANSGMAAWTRHRKEVSIDSVMSDFSGIHLGRPGLGDKMFSNAGDHGVLTSISASPPESTSSSSDSITSM